MKEMVHLIAGEIAEEGLEDPENIRKRERILSRGYWSESDELQFLAELERELELLTEEHKLSEERRDRMEEKILARDEQLEEKVMQRER